MRLATVHFKPSGGKTPADNCRMYEPFIAEAARRKADLVVLGETLTFVGLGKSYADVAEPVPGPSTEYFGRLARKHNIYIVPGLLERDGHLVYNVAVLIGPDGKIVGKYRKVCLPRGEIDGGVAPGSDYPVFPTRFGKVGMMVCYDGFFPEVARELTNRGAEVIAWPVWGCNPLLARARACENHVYLVSSTYEDVSRNWMISAVFDHTGETIAQAQRLGHGGGCGGRPEPAHALGQPRRLQGGDSAASAGADCRRHRSCVRKEMRNRCRAPSVLDGGRFNFEASDELPAPTEVGRCRASEAAEPSVFADADCHLEERFGGFFATTW